MFSSRTSRFTAFIILIILITFFALGKSLSFALNGDDWQALWRYTKDFTSLQSHFELKNFSTEYSNYTIANLIMGFIYRIWGFSPFPYYFISMTLRIIAILSFYPAIYSATRSKFVAILSSVFIASMFAGIETTNWVFNMNTYAAIVFFNLFLYFFFKRKDKILSKRTLFLTSLLFMTFLFAPTRFHGLLFIIPLIVLFNIEKFSRRSLTDAIINCLIFYFPIILFRFITRTTKDIDYLQTFSQIIDFKEEYTINLFATLGNSFIPDIIFTSTFTRNSTRALITVLIYVFLIYIFYNSRRDQPNLARFGLFSLLITIAFMLIPWLINPAVILPTYHRYQIIPGSFMLIAIAISCSIIWQIKRSFLKGIIIILSTVIIITNLFTLRGYFSTLGQEGRLQKDVDKQFNYIISQLETPKNNAPLVLLFIPDDYFYLYNAISFGFSYHLILIDPRFSMDIKKAPFVTDNIDSLIDVLSSEKSTELKRYGYNPVKIPLENVSAFQLQNQDLMNITPEIKQYLKERLPKPDKINY